MKHRNLKILKNPNFRKVRISGKNRNFKNTNRPKMTCISVQRGQYSYIDVANEPQNVRQSNQRHEDGIVVTCLQNMQLGGSSRQTEVG